MKVSICIPTYNQALYLEQAIQSGARQKLLPMEIIVSNDCSTDNTAEVLERLSEEIPFLKVINHAKNNGIAKNTDACLRLAKGDFIVRLDSDDYLSPDYIEKLSKLLDKYPEAGYAHANVQEINQAGSILRQRRLYRKSCFQSGTEALRAAAKGYRVAANIIMFRKDALSRVDYIKSRPDYVEDYHLSASLASAGYGNVYLNESLSFYRVWIDTAKVRQRRKLMEIVGLYRVFKEVLEPAFRERGWNLASLRIRRASLACTQADCLGWSVYSESEKQELKVALHELSSSRRAKIFVWLYLQGYGSALNVCKKVWTIPRSVVKNFLSSF